MAHESEICPYKHYRKKYFGFGGDIRCYHRRALKEDIKRKEVEEYHQRFEEDNPDLFD